MSSPASRQEVAVAGAQTAAPRPLRSQVVRGVGWKLGSQAVIQVTRLVVGIVLARLLTPHEYGLAAMAVVFSGAALIFTDLSLGAALVQRAHIDERDRSTVFWTSAAMGVVCALLGIGSSGYLARFFGEPAVQPLFAAVSVTFFVTSLCSTQAALLTRELAFRSLQLREIAASLAAGALALALAFAGFGAWAIVSQSLVASGVSLVLLWRFSAWRPTFTFSVASLRELGSFGIKTFGSRLLNYVTLNADNLLIGRFLGSSALGTYSLAYNLMLAPFSRLTAPIQQVLFPAFSRMQADRGRVASAWLRANRLTAAVSVPSFLGLIAVAPDLVTVLFGERWSAAVPVLQLLSLAGLVYSLQVLNWSVLQARGRPGVLLRFQLLSATSNVAAFALGLRWGVEGVAAFFAISRALLLFPYTRVTCRALGIGIREFAGSLSGVVLTSFGMFVATFGLRELLVDAGIGVAPRLGLVVAAGAVTFIALSGLTAPGLVGEFRSLVRRRRTATTTRVS